MPESIGKPSEFELWDHMRTMTGWRSEASEQLRELAEAVKILPDIKRELDRQSVALFSTNADNEITNMRGLVPMVREVVIGYKVAKGIAYALGGCVMGLLGLLIGVLKKLTELGVLEALIK